MKKMTSIQKKIYEIRGQKVLLDYDLAAMYGVETRSLKQAVKRNIERFEGEDFMFELTIEEANFFLRSQIVTLKMPHGKHFKYAPYAFTELGVAMLSSVLRSKTAIEVNRGIMRAFVEFRQLAVSLPTNQEIKEIRDEVQRIKDEMNEILADQNDINESNRTELELINRALAELQVERTKKTRRRIGFIQYDEDGK